MLNNSRGAVSHLRGSSRSSRRRNPAPVVRQSHPSHHSRSPRTILHRHPLGARPFQIAKAQNPEPLPGIQKWCSPSAMPSPQYAAKYGHIKFLSCPGRAETVSKFHAISGTAWKMPSPKRHESAKVELSLRDWPRSRCSVAQIPADRNLGPDAYRSCQRHHAAAHCETR